MKECSHLTAVDKRGQISKLIYFYCFTVVVSFADPAVGRVSGRVFLFSLIVVLDVDIDFAIIIVAFYILLCCL